MTRIKNSTDRKNRTQNRPTDRKDETTNPTDGLPSPTLIRTLRDLLGLSLTLYNETIRFDPNTDPDTYKGKLSSYKRKMTYIGNRPTDPKNGNGNPLDSIYLPLGIKREDTITLLRNWGTIIPDELLNPSQD